ncbi:TOMM precursor leader peptide-binding protein [Ktedonospora formicarum]|uniref:YcaO domain-containing protein n=1 Tax=Ktedonospora formicarum TaxID=2778364 RepID=A0A8J3MZC7_9CHLR|nr:TOMM precursor leader peptide-binding protein [Ktedonospora formicarum]GHO50660.1 hypothetical protein KSX_88230 [Ktedonospora formicarum]
MLAQNMRPKLKADLCYIPLHDGLYLRSNNCGLILKGKSLYRLLEHLLPNLNGKVTLEEITDGLDQNRKRMVTNLIEKLFAHHFLQDTSQDQPHALRPVVRETYSPDITFIDSFQTSAPSRFECFRNKRLLLIGSGLSFTLLVQASLQCGVKQIDMISTPESKKGSKSSSGRLDVFAPHDSEQIVRVIDTPSWDNETSVLASIQGYDAILHLSERPMLARAQLLNRLCIEQRKTFIQAIMIDDHVWVGPLVGPDTGGCWECAWRRLQANLTNLSEQFSRYEFHDQPIASPSRFLAMPIATMTANRLVFELFKYFTQAWFTKTVGNIVDIDLETLISKSHMFLPHPHCLACQHPILPTASSFLEQIEQLQRQSPINPNTLFEENIARYIDDRFGLFTTLDNNHFVQVPLAVYKIHLSNPMLRKCQYELLDVIAVDTDMGEARLRALQRASERYAATLVDRRRLLPCERVHQHVLPTISTDQWVGIKQPLPEVSTYTWALDLHRQQAYLVPAEYVFPALNETAQEIENERGIASGMTWEEAICQALLDWCNYLSIEQLKDAHHSFLQVDLASAPMTPEGTHLYRLLKVAAEQLTIYDVTGTLQVPTFATCLNGMVIAYSTHFDVAQALKMGLEQALQQLQAERCQQPEYAVAPVLDFPLTRRRNQLHVPQYMLPEAWPDRQAWLLRTLQTNGLRALAIPLNHDPAVTQVLSAIVRVLLTRTEVKNG